MHRISSEDPQSKSLDQIAANLLQLKVFFPEAFAEDKVDFNVLRQLLGEAVDEGEEKYGLNWHGKHRARQLALTLSTGTLRPCPEESVDWETTQNLMIEGDNLEVLKLLQKSYAGKVKLIYIDPPYNTGKDFVYPDDFRDNMKNYQRLMGWLDEDGKRLSSQANRQNTQASGRFHTDWLNMVYPRLKLARALLKLEGYLVVSIDDHEVGNLRLACDDVFGEENFIANVIWQKKYTRANDAKFFSDNHDHLLVYARDASVASLGRVDRGEEQLSAYTNPDNHPKGVWKATPLHARSGTNTRSYTFANGVTWAPPPGTYRRFSDETMKELDSGNEIWFGVDGGMIPSRKSFLSEMDEGMVPVTVWDYKYAGHNHEANNELKALGLGGAFISPKPTRLISRMLELFTAPDTQDIVLDFFAGSGTTGHAVMAQNATDPGNRRYVLVQLPEHLDPDDKDQKIAATLCDEIGATRSLAEITKERLRRAAKKIKDENPMFPGDLGFRVFKLDTSNIHAWEPDRGDLVGTLKQYAEHLKTDRTEQDILYELLLKLGLDLCVPIEERVIAGKTVHSIGAGVLLACLAPQIAAVEVEPLALGIVAWHKEQVPAGETMCVFRDSAFADDVAKTNLTVILQQHGLENVRSL